MIRAEIATQDDINAVAAENVSRGYKSLPQWIPLTQVFKDDDGCRVGVGGLILMSGVTAWVWFLATERIKDSPLASFRCMKTWMRTVMDQFGIYRAMAAVDPTFPEAVRVVEHLGFHKESTMHGFLKDKQPADMYVYFRE